MRSKQEVMEMKAKLTNDLKGIKSEKLVKTEGNFLAEGVKEKLISSIERRIIVLQWVLGEVDRF